MNANACAASILVVDDDEQIFRALSRSLRRHRYSMTYAPDAEAGLAALSEQNFDVIISDNRMPGMTGLELLELVRVRHPDTVRVLLSADVDPVLVDAAVKRGAVFRTLSKPWRDEELTSALRFALQYSRELAFGAHLNATFER